mmetsp:Transcript_12698/g.22852  ORF Transcript_12698/g.22852 Transcript_12698/m.22852 type:complete len:267 (+) Transcript_12698:169-969(+)
MDGAKPGHTVRFQGLKGAAHLNGTEEGTLVKFSKKEKRWSVRCDPDNAIVNAKPENLLLHRNYNVKTQDEGHTAWDGAGGRLMAPTNSSAANDSSSWAHGLSQKDQYEWFSNRYQMRCDDDYAWGGCNLHGPYNPEATPRSVCDDFFVYCILAHRAKAIPADWDWSAFLKAAASNIPFAFEKSDAKERWGSENYFEGAMGGRSLRYTGAKIYKSAVDQMGDSTEHAQAERDSKANKVRGKLQKQLGGLEAWKNLVQNLSRCSRFSS